MNKIRVGGKHDRQVDRGRAAGCWARGGRGAPAATTCRSRTVALGQEIYDLHTLILWICVVIFIGVFGVMFYSMLKHRKSVGHKAAHFHENTTVEIIWTIVPFFILIGMAWPATKTMIATKDTSSADLTIKATGYQWKWGYDYLKGEGEGISFYSTLSPRASRSKARAPKGENYLLEVDNPLVVPVGKKVRILITATDVLHAWWVPALAAKQDAIPGFVRDTWFKAEREGTLPRPVRRAVRQGTRLHADRGGSGVGGEVQRRGSTSGRRRWPQRGDDPNKDWTLDELKARGEKVFAQNCVACHQANGMGIPGTFPALSGSAVVNGPKDEQIDVVLNGVVKDGKPTAMLPFKQLSDVDIAAVITYTRNAWSNKVGDAVTPAEVKAARKGVRRTIAGRSSMARMRTKDSERSAA